MNYYQIVAFAQNLKNKNMAVYNNDRDPNDIMWEKQNDAFTNDPNNDLDIMMEGLINQYFDAIKKHDYSYMFSDDNRYYEAGHKNENHIKELLHGLIGICRVDAERLLEDSLSEVKEQFVDGLTHKVINQWFEPYLPKPINKEYFKEVDGMYFVAHQFDVDGDGWVNEEQLELLLHEYNNGVK
jgi:hypothetical protein